jgi:hypothetical protein
MKTAFFTIASSNYLPYVRVLMESIGRLHPEARRFLCLVDTLNSDSNHEPFEIVQADELGIPFFEDFAFRYDIMELNTAVKPFVFRWLREQTDCDALLYIDPDIRLFGRLDEVLQPLSAGASAVLTPHITKPLEDGQNPADLSMLQVGVFNLGFIALARGGEADSFVDWWARKLQTQCISDLPSGLFVDQKWCDLAPCLLDKLFVLRHSGYNVAYWNLAHRPLAKDGVTWTAAGQPLRFFHFSGVDPRNPSMLSKHQTRYKEASAAGAAELVANYCADVNAAGWGQVNGTDYAYGWHTEGAQIHAVLRRLYRRIYPEPQSASPFIQPIETWANRPYVKVEGSDVAMTPLMSLIYALRPDLQVAFPMAQHEPTSAARFADWFETAGPREYMLTSSLCVQAEIKGAPETLKKKYDA